MTEDLNEDLNPTDADRLALLDRLADRLPELDLAQQSVEWTTLDDGHEALLVNGGGIDGGHGAFFANHGDDVHVVGSLAPLAPGAIGCIVIRPDGSGYVAASSLTRWRNTSRTDPRVLSLQLAQGRQAELRDF